MHCYVSFHVDGRKEFDTCCARHKVYFASRTHKYGNMSECLHVFKAQAASHFSLCLGSRITVDVFNCIVQAYCTGFRQVIPAMGCHYINACMDTCIFHTRVLCSLKIKRNWPDKPDSFEPRHWLHDPNIL